MLCVNSPGILNHGSVVVFYHVSMIESVFHLSSFASGEGVVEKTFPVGSWSFVKPAVCVIPRDGLFSPARTPWASVIRLLLGQMT